jgi:hypothetical protein
METVQLGLVNMILLAILLGAVMTTGLKMVRFGRGMVELIPRWISGIATERREVVDPAGGDWRVCVAEPLRTVFFDKEVSFPARRVLYPALFVYGPTSLAR